MNKPIYCPVLRFKRGEKNALKNLSINVKFKILPILVVTAHKFNPLAGCDYDDTFDSYLSKDAKDLISSWKGFPSYIDMAGINPDAICIGGADYVKFFFEKVFEEDSNININPVVSRSDNDKYISYVVNVCKFFDITPVFRVTPNDLINGACENFINDIFKQCGCNAGNSNIVVDMGYIKTIDNASAIAEKALLALPFADDWASITLAAGSFPTDLTGFDYGTYSIARSEWDVWQLEYNRLGRCIRYGDYATIHPILPKKELSPEKMNPSASVKYTSGNKWLLIRGRGTRKRQGDNLSGFTQFFDHADLLCNSLEYRGEDFSYGDQRIMSIHERKAKHGNIETWITICVNHHITEIVYQLSNQS